MRPLPRSGTMPVLQRERRTAMLDSVKNLKTSEIELEQRLPQLECAWLVRELRGRRGIAAAECASDAGRLTVEYDADRIDRAGLVDILSSCGVEVAAVHPGHL
jgi:hypothetical protein